MQLTTSLSDLMDLVLISTLPAAYQSSYWLFWSVFLPEVLCISRAEHSVGPKKARSVFFPTVLTAPLGGPPPKTMTKEWQEASNERARELNLDPITGKCSRRPFLGLQSYPNPLPGVPSEGYSGKGFVQSK